MFCQCRLPHSNYLHRMPRTSHYQTTPFTIDPSARSTQTFAERYGVSPPHSNENLYGNDYTITGHDDKCSLPRASRQARNHKVELSKPSASSNIIQQAGNNNNNTSGGADSSKASKSSVIKGSAITPNNTHSTAFDVEHRLQVSLLRRDEKFPRARVESASEWPFKLKRRNLPPHLCQRQFLEPFMHAATCSRAENVAEHQQEASGEAFRGDETAFWGRNRVLCSNCTLECHRRNMKSLISKSYWGLLSETCAICKADACSILVDSLRELFCHCACCWRFTADTTRWRLLRLHNLWRRKKGKAAVKFRRARCESPCLHFICWSLWRQTHLNSLPECANYENCDFSDRKHKQSAVGKHDVTTTAMLWSENC